VRRGSRGSRRVAVLRHDDQRVHALENHVLDLVVLQLLVVVGNLGDDLRAGVIAELGHERLFHRPALGGEIRERKADLDLRALGHGFASLGRAVGERHTADRES